MADINPWAAADKIEDFKRNPSYERRVVAFYDVLGWRSEIEKAGIDPNRIGDLRRLILSHTRVLRMPVEAPVNRGKNRWT